MRRNVGFLRGNHAAKSPMVAKQARYEHTSVDADVASEAFGGLGAVSVSTEPA